MKNGHKRFHSSLLLTILLLVFALHVHAAAHSFLTREALKYIGTADTVQAVSMAGAAPSRYAGPDGEIRDISKRTGLRLEYHILDTYPAFLDDKRYAAVTDSALPEGIGSIDATTQMDRRITLNMVMDSYGTYIFAATGLFILLLVFSYLRNLHVKHQLKVQIERYRMLSLTSNEYLYEYHVAKKKLDLSQNCLDLFDEDRLSEVIASITDTFLREGVSSQTIELPVPHGENAVFKTVNLPIQDAKGKVYSVIGKLIDVSQEEAEKQELIRQSERDGLTGLYNAVTVKVRVDENLKTAEPGQTALLVIDGDRFKGVNDTHGHVAGNAVLVNISKAITVVFGQSAISGRVGGDEFCVFLPDISPSELISKCQEFLSYVRELNRAQEATISIGIAWLSDERSYEALLSKADIALYEAKKAGGGRYHVFS